MPSIYSNLYQNFIRQGFAKSFTNGYAQSVVAATHPHVLSPQNRPAFPRRGSNRFSRLQTLQLQSAFHSVASSSSVTADYRHERFNNHGGLEAYYEALRASQAGGEADSAEWEQFQFQKQLEWQPSGGRAGEAKGTAAQAEADGAADQADQSALLVEDEATLAKVDEKLIEVQRQQQALEEADAHKTQTPTPSLASEVASRSATPAADVRSATPPTSAAPSQESSVVDPQAQAYAEHLQKLSEAGRYAEIPAVFEAMLVAGIQPTAPAYNAVLASALHLPKEKSEVIGKALDVYTDMLRRKVAPDSLTYDTLVGLLAARCLEVSEAKKLFETKRLRYGGMDEPGKFMFASHQVDYAILCEEDRLDLALRLFDSSVAAKQAAYHPETYHEIISACAQAGRKEDMIRLFEYMESSGTPPHAATFPAMITAFADSGDLISAVECYNEYRDLAIANDKGETSLLSRQDAQAYASVIRAYVVSDKLAGATKFYNRIVEQQQQQQQAADETADVLVAEGFVTGLIQRQAFAQALEWAETIRGPIKPHVVSSIATAAADHGDAVIASQAFGRISPELGDVSTPASALLALAVRQANVTVATEFWNVLSNPAVAVSSALIEPVSMYAVAMIASGQVASGLTASETMFERIRTACADSRPTVADEIDEGVEFIAKFMKARGVIDTRGQPQPTVVEAQQLPFTPTTAETPVTPVTSNLDTFDPHGHNTDFKASAQISSLLEPANSPRLNNALAIFHKVRAAGRHPRYLTYAKLITAAAREKDINLCFDIMGMARQDMPLDAEYAVCRYGWTAILDSMLAALLTAGNRSDAETIHQELLQIGAAPSANTYGLYIATLKAGGGRVADEATVALNIMRRAREEGVVPTNFLYNALIGKLAKARRTSDCLFYFAEMRTAGIKATAVTYGTVINALCRVGDGKFAEELFDEMEALPNYKPRAAPYNTMMQLFLAQLDKPKLLKYYERMVANGLQPTSHTFKLLIDAHATLEPHDMAAAESVLDAVVASGQEVKPVHHAAMIAAKGCVQRDMAAARAHFDAVVGNRDVPADPSYYQALFESMAANHVVAESESVLRDMAARGVEVTPYIANALIHGWTTVKRLDKARKVYDSVPNSRREPSTYEAMVRACLASSDPAAARRVRDEMRARGYPLPVTQKVVDLVDHWASQEMKA